MTHFLLILRQEMVHGSGSTFPLLVEPRDFCRREAEKLVTDRENKRNDNFATLESG